MGRTEFTESLKEYLENMEDFEIIDSDKKSLYGIYRGHTLYFQSYVKGIKNKIFDNVEDVEEICDTIVKKIEKNEMKLKKLTVKKIKKVNVKEFVDEESLMSIEEREKHYNAMIGYYSEKLLDMKSSINGELNSEEKIV